MKNLQIGKLNKLTVLKNLSFGLYLDGGDLEEILLPRKYVPENVDIGDTIEVFVYFDSKDIIIATTEEPYACVGDFAYLKVVSTNSIGAFLDWGLIKDLFVPFREQKNALEKDKYYPVYIYFDKKSRRIAGTTRIRRYLDKEPVNYKVNEEVDLFIYGEEEIGYQAIINGKHEGLLYKNEVFKPLKLGRHLKGFIKKLREDEKIDLCLEKPGYEKVGGLAEDILKELHKQGGNLNITDKCSPEVIYSTFNVSKKNYKKAVSALYKQRLILIDDKGIRLTIKAKFKK